MSTLGKVRRGAGWVLTAVVVAFFVFGGSSSLTKAEQSVDGTKHVEWSTDLMPVLGGLMIACAVVYAIPPTAVLGAIMLTGYLGGACAAHLRVHDTPDKVAFPVVFGVLAWLGVALRDPRLFRLVFART